jgi:DNA-binding NarL/FixJ family response regulator
MPKCGVRHAGENLLKKTVRVLVVDDYEPWRRFAASTLHKKPELEIVGEASDGLLAVERAQALQPDLILLDIGLPSQNGIEAARQIRELSPKSKIIFVSENRSVELAQGAARAGALGYVVKSNVASELLPAITAVLDGRCFSSSCLGQNIFTGARSQALEDSNLSETAVIANGNGRWHQVAFYPDDASFVDGFADFASTRISAGSHVVVVATASHRANIRRVLAENGVDVERAIQLGTFVEADAHELLSAIMVNEMPERARVENLAASMLVKRTKALNGSDPRVAVCGELAPTLLANGNVEAAIQIEHIFDSFTKTNKIDVLCGYVGSSFPRDGRKQIFERICAEHSAVRDS